MMPGQYAMGVPSRAGGTRPSPRGILRPVRVPVLKAQLRAGAPDFLDLPWGHPVAEWSTLSGRVLELERGVSRHEVLFVSYDQRIFAVKLTTAAAAAKEYATLLQTEERGLPTVRAVGWLSAIGSAEEGAEPVGALITEFLDGSLPFRTMFRGNGLQRYQNRLLDAMAGLLVRLHLAGCYWGDCSLSNTLFLRDAGELAAYLVDAETSEVHPSLSEGQRRQDLLILEENVAGELVDLQASGASTRDLDPFRTGALICQRYERLWREVTREEVLAPGDTWRVQERIRSLNALGFTVSEVELVAEAEGPRLRLRTMVTDRNYHRHQLHGLTGLSVEEHQAQLMLNEIREMRAEMSRERNQSVPLSVAAYAWRGQRFAATTARLSPLIDDDADAAQIYCQVLEHKWFLSEQAARDVGLVGAVEDYLARFGPRTRKA